MTTAVLLGEPLPVELMNTLNGGRDGIDDALDDSAAWLEAVAPRLRDEAGIALDATESDSLRPLRDALRALAGELTDDTRTPRPMPRGRALTVLNTLATARPELTWPDGSEMHRTVRTEGTPAERAVAFFAHQAVDLLAGDQRPRLRACQGPNCLLFFLKDHPRREWCSPACGNRARVQRHYQRHHGNAGDERTK